MNDDEAAAVAIALTLLRHHDDAAPLSESEWLLTARREAIGLD